MIVDTKNSSPRLAPWAFLFAVRRAQNPLPGTLRPESRHCLTLIFPACRRVFYSRPREPSSTCLLVKSSRGPDPF
nr:MAG TPA: hypothetical protein [Caudoviricetes sp.]